ncbi:Nitric-oxide reductase (EC, quinol-dependent [uncultured Gammaproteobacteria bacterium]|nr:Nitric-oxide reductase (EC, quinol-dependent [uncultured Gammaproteobacteria bacterium]
MDRFQQAPPIPNAVQIVNGNVIYSKQDIEDGQNIWQTIGGMQQGSIWGHGSYLAPDWSADWLHREALSLLDIIKSSGFYLNNKYKREKRIKSS